MSWIDIATLVQEAIRGDRAAYGEIVTRFESTVYAVALSRLRNPGEAQELTHEVFVHAMTKLDQLRDPECLAGWLRQITVRMAINRLARRGCVRPADQAVLEGVPAGGDGPLDEMVRSEDRAEVLDGLARLKPLDRDTLTAFYLRGQSLRQMSREFETPIGTIKRRLHVARQRLRRLLDRDPEELACV
jgi:RNA polymerase sigma-70 factor (ECF subfamily)